MRNYDGATGAYLASRAGMIAKQLIWIAAPRLDNGTVETIGFWTGEDSLQVVIDGEARTYLGAGRALVPDAIRATTGLVVRSWQVRLSGADGDVEDLVKGYNTRFAPIESHRAYFHPETRALVSEPVRKFRGFINGIEYPRASAGGVQVVTVDAVSETRALTRTLAAKKSDQSQRLRGGDAFRKYGDISGAVPVYWGERYEITAD